MSEVEGMGDSSEEFYIESFLRGLEDPDLSFLYECEDISPEMRNLIEQGETLPKIATNALFGNWVEIQAGYNRFVLTAIGRTAAGVLCERMEHTGETSFTVVQGSITTIDNYRANEGLLKEAAAFFANLPDYEASKPVAISVAPLDEDGDAVESRQEAFLYDRTNMMRDSYLQIRNAYTVEQIEQAVLKNEEFEDASHLMVERVSMPLGGNRVFFVDLGSFTLSLVERARVISEEGVIVKTFGRADAPSWNHSIRSSTS